MPSFKIVGLLVMKKIFKGFCHGGHLGHVTWTIYINVRSPLPKDAPHEVWLWLVKLFQKRRSLKLWKMDDDDNGRGRRRMDAGAWPFWAFSSGGLKCNCLKVNIDCGYSLEPPRLGGSNMYPQSMFWANIRKISIYWKFSFFTTLKISVYCMSMFS